MISWLALVLAQARGKSLYDLHPELTERVPILRLYSDQAETGGMGSMADFYSANIWVHKAIKTVADNLAPLPIEVRRLDGEGDAAVAGHPVADLLANPNPEMGPAELWREWVINMDLAGEHGLEATPSASGRKVVELWPREAQDFSVQIGPQGRRYRRVLGYKIDDNEGNPYTLPPEQFVHFKFYNPLSPWRGLAPLTAARTGIVIDQLAQAWTRLFFRNQARPDFAIVAPAGITKTEKDDILLQLDAQVGGGAGLHRPLVLEQGITDIKVFSYPPKDLQWIEQRKLAREEIGAIIGVPDEMMGWGRDTYENFDTADRVLWTVTVVPLAGLRDSTLTRFFRRIKLLAPNERVATDWSGVPQLQEDRSGKITQWHQLVSDGVPGNLVSDFLDLGLPHYNGGDYGYLPLGMTPVTSVDGKDLPARSWKGAAIAAGDRDQPQLPGAKQLAPAYGSPEHEAYWKSRQSDLDDPVAEIQRILKREIQRQQNEIGAALRNSRAFGRGLYKDPDRIPPVEELFDYDGEVAAFIEALKASIDGAIAAVGQAGIEAVLDGGLFDVERPEVASGIRLVLETVSRKVNNTTFSDLVELFQEAEAAGEGIPAIQERLSAYFGDRKSDWQTERIARTTLTGAANFGSLEAWGQSGVVESHSWISALLPDRTRDSHAEAHGQTVGLSEMFTVGGESLAYPGDPAGSPGNIINCLCVTRPNVREE